MFSKLYLLYELWNRDGYVTNAIDDDMMKFLLKTYQKARHDISHLPYIGEKTLGEKFNVCEAKIGFTVARDHLVPISFAEINNISNWVYPVEIFGHFRHAIDYDLGFNQIKKNFFRDIHEDVINLVNEGKGKILVNYSQEGWVTDALFAALYYGIKEVGLNPKGVIVIINDINCKQRLKEFLDRYEHIKIYDFPVIINYCYYVTQSAGFVNSSHKIFFDDFYSNKKYKFLSLNRRFNLQRFLILGNLYEDLKNESSISLDKNLMIDDLRKIIDGVEFPSYLTDSDRRLFLNAKEKFDKLPDQLFIDTTQLNSTDGYDHLASSPFKDSWVSIVTETSFFQSNDFLSEKIWKPVWYFQPFIVAGRPHMLKYMRELGYKTFDWLFDESYDDIEDNGERMKKILSEIKRVNEIPFEELKELILKHKDLLIHNHNLLDNFGNNRFYFEKKIIDICNHNLDFVYYDLIKEEPTYEKID